MLAFCVGDIRSRLTDSQRLFLTGDKRTWRINQLSYNKNFVFIKNNI